MPMHCLDPFENVTRYCPKILLLALVSSQREGSNLSGSGKSSSLRCIIHELILTIVWEGFVNNPGNTYLGT